MSIQIPIIKPGRFLKLLFIIYYLKCFYFRVLKDDAVDLCRVWKDDIGSNEFYIWCIIVGLPPNSAGTCFNILHGVFIFHGNTVSGVSSIDTSTIPQQRYIVTALSALVTISYSTNLVLTEKYLQPVFNLNQFISLMLKYFLGSIDLILAPLIICLIDTEIRQGIVFLYKRKRERPGTGNLR